MSDSETIGPDSHSAARSAGANAPTLEQVVLSVLAWQRAHFLAKRLGPEAVHSVGWVALPFLRAPQEAAQPRGSAWRRAVLRMLRRSQARTASAIPAFNEVFIDGVRPAAAAAFALRYGIDSLPKGDDWPQRRIELDGDLASNDPAGWPFERWVVSAALDGPNGRRRVLIAASAPGDSLPVMGRRHWDTPRLIAAGALMATGFAALMWALQTPKPIAPEVRVAGAVVSVSDVPPASSPAASTAISMPAEPPPAASAAAPASAVASAQPPPMDVASGQAAASSQSLSNVKDTGPARIDIRPRLRPIRDGDKPRPPLLGGTKPASIQPNAASAADSGSLETANIPPPVGPKASASAAGKAIASPTAEEAPRLELRNAGPATDTIALVSRGYAQRAEAEAMLTRMLEHLRSTLGPGKPIEGAVFESPQGYRAATWPFSSREEAQVLNATMIARGWRTRAVNF